YTVTSAGSTVTVSNPAAFRFVPADFQTPTGFGATVDSSSVHAFDGTVTATVTGTVHLGDKWQLVLNGNVFEYTAAQGERPTEVATGLAAKANDPANAALGFTATHAGATVTVTYQRQTLRLTGAATNPGGVSGVSTATVAITISGNPNAATFTAASLVFA